MSKESAYSYYDRLCQWDHSVCYLWIAQAFYGFTLEKLKLEVIDIGKDATFFISNKEPMEMSANLLMAFIQGREIDLNDHQKIPSFIYDHSMTCMTLSNRSSSKRSS